MPESSLQVYCSFARFKSSIVWSLYLRSRMREVSFIACIRALALCTLYNVFRIAQPDHFFRRLLTTPRLFWYFPTYACVARIPSLNRESWMNLSPFLRLTNLSPALWRLTVSCPRKPGSTRARLAPIPLLAKDDRLWSIPRNISENSTRTIVATSYCCHSLSSWF